MSSPRPAGLSLPASVTVSTFLSCTVRQTATGTPLRRRTALLFCILPSWVLTNCFMGLKQIGQALLFNSTNILPPEGPFSPCT